MTNEELKETRRQMFDKMEKHLWEDKKPEDSVFYYHPSEDRIVSVRDVPLLALSYK